MLLLLHPKALALAHHTTHRTVTGPRRLRQQPTTTKQASTVLHVQHNTFTVKLCNAQRSTARHSTGLLLLPVPHVVQPAPVPVHVRPCPASRRPHQTHAPAPGPARVSAAQPACATRPDLRHCRLHTALQQAAAAAAADRHTGQQEAAGQRPNLRQKGRGSQQGLTLTDFLATSLLCSSRL